MLRSPFKRKPVLPAFSRHFVTLFMILLAVPALMLLWLNVSALWEQWFADAPSAAWSAKDPEQLAAALERRSSDLALDALHDPELVGSAWSGVDSLEQRRLFRSAVARVRQRHPIIQNIFIVRNGTVEFPRLTTPAPMSRDRYVAAFAGEHAQRVNALLTMAERQQHAGLYTKAIETLAQAERATDAAPLKALIAQRTAACFRAMGLPDQAQSMYRMLASRYGDQYSPEGLPYAVVASLVSHTVSARLGETRAVEPGAQQERTDSAELGRVYRLLINGRWELSAEQVTQLRAAFRKRLGDAGLRESTEYLDEFDMARALQQAVRQPVQIRRRERTPQQISGKPDLSALAFAGTTNYQSYFRTITRSNGDRALLGLTVDLDWLQRTVCPDLGIGDTLELGYTRDAVATDVSTPFKTAFPFWTLRPATAAARQSAAHLENMIAMSSEVLAAVLCFGLFALHRHVAREREAIRMRSDFVSGVSHELKTPITVIRLYSETLMECPTVQPEGREYCEIISYEAQRLDRLVEAVLNVAAIERGAKTYNLENGDLGALTTQILAHIRGYYRYKGYNVAEDIARDLPFVKVDGEAFRSALLNLVDNAIKYSSSSHVVWVWVYHTGESVVVAVEDFGIGIAPDALERIFDPFYRAGNATTHGGCGLGLFLVRHIMTAHGGRVRVKSKLGSGSRFELVFPIARRRETAMSGAGTEGAYAVRGAEARLHRC